MVSNNHEKGQDLGGGGGGGGGGGVVLPSIIHIVLLQRVGFLNLFGLKTFCSFWSGFQGTAGVYMMNVFIVSIPNE